MSASDVLHDLEEAQYQEVLRRMRAVEEGKEELLDHEVVMAELRAIVPHTRASLEGSSELTYEDKAFIEVERRWHAIETGAEETVSHEEALDFVFAPLRKKVV